MRNRSPAGRGPARRTLIWAALAVAVLASGAARAQHVVASDDRAGELNRQSLKLFKEGRYTEAAALLREAYRVRPDPVLLHNLGRACELMGDWACAVGAYEKYLATVKWPPPDLTSITTRLAHCREKLAPPAPPPAPAPISDVPAPRSRSIAPPIVAAVGAAGFGVGAAMAFVARQRHDDAIMDPSQRGAMSKDASARSLMSTANTTMITGGAVALAGALWWLLDGVSSAPSSPDRPEDAPTLVLGITPRSVTALVKF